MRTSTHKSGKDKNMNQLEVLRESLGQCDEIILDALLMRNRIVEDIMVYKEANNVPILQPEQEAKQRKNAIKTKLRMFSRASQETVKRFRQESCSIIILY